MSQTTPRSRADGARLPDGSGAGTGRSRGVGHRLALALNGLLCAAGRLAPTMRRLAPRHLRGMGTVEFALASLLFLPITLGTFDLGRAVFEHSRLTNAVREGARYGKVNPTENGAIETRVRDYAGGMAITSVATTPSASPCDPGLCRVTVTANAQFNMVTAGFLNAILGGALPASFTMSSSATVGVE